MNTALLVDGGHLRSCFKKANIDYTLENIEGFCNRYFLREELQETVYRIFYYDAPHFEGDRPRPISGETVEFRNKDKLLNKLSELEDFAIRKGRLKWAGWKLKPAVLQKMKADRLT